MRQLAVAAVLLVAALTAGLAGSPPAMAGGAPPKLPVEAFGKLPFMEHPVLSPDGNRVAAELNANGTSVLGILDLRAKAPPTLIPTGDNVILWTRWAGNSRLLIGFNREVKTVYGWGHISQVMLYDLAKRDMKVLALKGQAPNGDDVIHVADDGSFILMSVARNLDSFPEVFRVDLDTAKWTNVVPQREFIGLWLADADGVVRASAGVQYRQLKWLYRSSATEEFATVGRVDLDVEEFEVPQILLRRRGEGAYALATSPEGRQALYEFDLKSFKPGKLVFAHPTADVTDARLNPEGTAVEAAFYADDRDRVEWLDGRMKAVQAEIDEALPGRQNRLAGASRDRTRFVVFTTTASDPGYYYFYDHGSGVLSRLGLRYEALKDATLAPVKSVSYRSHDGLTIPAYLTLPAGRAPRGLPLIVVPHGGPFARDVWEFDPWVQFLANRGYAVLQPNYRGSTGYGREFIQKGFGQFGTGMMEDINAGVRWLVADGVADPARVCIMGGSFGGYAALWGAITAPDLYRCAISFAGVTDFEDMMTYDREYLLPVTYKWMKNRLDGTGDQDLKAISPTDQAERLTRPVLLVHGEEDRTVPIEQSIKLAHALKRLDKTFEFVRMEDVRHGFATDAQHTAFLTKVDDFLARYNPAD
ncbi:MAG: S9 family peptidase [Gammaproteobacteria bacterium]|nr:S9 family peptidase [Gammaproteobacteria bacterium]